MKKDNLRVAIVAPPFGETGGPEVVVKNLAEALVKKGIDVTLFAPGDWKTSAKHVVTLPKSLWNMKDFKEQTDIERRNLIIVSQQMILKYQKYFDIIHLHSQRYAASVGSLAEKPCVLTLHNKINRRDFEQLKKSGVCPVAISNGRKRDLNGFCGVISNGIDVKNTDSSFVAGKYLMVLGRINEHKGFDLAIKIAQKTGKKLLIFGRIGNSEERQRYFNKKIKPHLSKNIIYKGEASRKEVFRYLKKAEALLFPMRIRLSMFPLVVMEAMACGTPVIGSSIKLIPKKMEAEMKGVSCFSDNSRDWIAAAKTADKFSRVECRKLAEKYFDNTVMAGEYVEIYRKILTKK